MNVPVKLENKESHQTRRLIVVMSRRQFTQRYPYCKHEYSGASNDFEELFFPENGEFFVTTCYKNFDEGFISSINKNYLRLTKQALENVNGSK